MQLYANKHIFFLSNHCIKLKFYQKLSEIFFSNLRLNFQDNWSLVSFFDKG